jgi:HSP20 family protein
MYNLLHNRKKLFSKGLKKEVLAMFDLTPFRRRRHMLPGDFGREMLRDFFDSDLWSGLGMDIRADIKENKKEYIVEAELPGMNKEQINVELKNNTLTISARQEDEVKEENENYVRRERKQGSISRSFYVENVDNEGVKADYKDGILKIILPKLKETEPDSYRINID